MTTTIATPLSASDRLRLERFLLRFSWAMQDYPRKEYLRIRRELRTEVRAAAADVGMRQALADLGHPVLLGERYISELGRRLPRWTSGIVAGGLAVGVLVYLFAAYAVGTLDTLEAMGGGSVTRFPFSTETVFTVTEDEISVLSAASWQWAVLYVGVAAVAFAVGSRLWRVLG